MQLGQRKPQREQYLSHPDFMERFGEAMQGVETPKDKIPEWMRKDLTSALLDMSFPALGVPVVIYEELCSQEPKDMSFGVLQKSADILFSCKPLYHLEHNSLRLTGHVSRIKCMGELLDAMREITDPIRDKVIDDLIAADSIIK